MTTYVGLTDDPERRHSEHGRPHDWYQVGPFRSEQAARDWERSYLSRPGYEGGPGGAGWQYGYMYTITRDTTE